jgi:hypothetical protein
MIPIARSRYGICPVQGRRKTEPDLFNERGNAEKADDAGLVESSGGQPRLEDDLKIKPCSPDPEPGSEDDLDWTPGNPAS